MYPLITYALTHPLYAFFKTIPYIASLVAFYFSLKKNASEKQNWLATCESEIFQLQVQALFFLKHLLDLTEVNLDKKFFDIFYTFQTSISKKRIFLDQNHRLFFNNLLNLAKKHYKHFEIVPESGCPVSPYYNQISEERSKLRNQFNLKISDSDTRNSFFEHQFEKKYSMQEQ